MESIQGVHIPLIPCCKHNLKRKKKRELFSHILKSRGEFNNHVVPKSFRALFAEGLVVNNRWRIATAWRMHRKKKHLDPAEFWRNLFMFMDLILQDVSTCHVCGLMFSHHNACLLLDALRSTPLRTDGDPSGFYRTRRDQQTPHKHREARNAQADRGGALDISTLPDNMTRIVVRSEQPTLRYVLPHLLLICLTRFSF